MRLPEQQQQLRAACTGYKERLATSEARLGSVREQLGQHVSALDLLRRDPRQRERRRLMTQQLLQAKVLAAVRGGALQALQARGARERQEAAAGVAELCDQQCALQVRCEQLELESSGSASMHAERRGALEKELTRAKAEAGAELAEAHAAREAAVREAAAMRSELEAVEARAEAEAAQRAEALAERSEAGAAAAAAQVEREAARVAAAEAAEAAAAREAELAQREGPTPRLWPCGIWLKLTSFSTWRVAVLGGKERMIRDREIRIL